MSFRSMAVMASALLAFGTQSARAEAAGVYVPAARWTKPHTVAFDLTENPLTLTVCWEQQDNYIYTDKKSYPEREVIFNLADVKSQVQAAVERGWKQFTNINFAWINNKFGSSCDIRIYLDERINDG